MGRISVDVYPLQVGVSLREVESFGKYLGGSSTNVAVAAGALRAPRARRSPARAPTRSASSSTTRCRASASTTATSRRSPGLATPVAFCEIFPPDDFPLYFYGACRRRRTWRSAPTSSTTTRSAPRACSGSRSPASRDEPSRSATLAALEARGKSGITVLDLDYRPMFWESREEAREWVGRALEHVTVAVGNLDETDTAVGEREPRAAARALRERGVELAVVKQGPKGVLADDGDDHVEVPPVPVEVVNGLGAGDAFGGALCHGLLSGWDLEREDALLQRRRGAGRLAAGVRGRDARASTRWTRAARGAHA